MEDSLSRLRQLNQQKSEQELSKKRHTEQVNSNAAMQRAIFSAFQSMTEALNGEKTKAEAISQIFRVLEQLDEKHKASEVDVQMLKAGLSTLEKELQEIPTDDLKKIPKFLERPDTMKVSNLKDIKEYFTDVTKAIKALKLNVEAPVVQAPKPVVVPAPKVDVEAPDLTPLTTSMDGVKKAVEKNKPLKLVKTEQMNTLIPEKFDEWKITYNTMDEDADDPEIDYITYYNKSKKVAKIKYSYKNGNLIGGKRV